MRWFAGWLYFLGGIALIGGAFMYVNDIPKAPNRDDLVEFSGFLIAVRLEKDFDGTDIVYLKFRDHPQVYKYMSTYPQYVEVRDRLGVYRQVDVLVERDAVDGTADSPPRRVWGLVEHDPNHEGTVVTYDDIYNEVTETDRSWQNVGLIMMSGALADLVLAFGIRKAVPYVPREPTA